MSDATEEEVYIEFAFFVHCAFHFVALEEKTNYE